MRPNVCKAAGIAVLTWAGAFAIGGEPKPESRSPLSGPQVEDRDVPGATETFGDPAEGDRATRERRIEPRAFFDVVRAMVEGEIPDELRLTEDQRERIRAIAEEFRVAAMAFREAHLAEIEALRKQAGLGRAIRGREGAPPPPRGEAPAPPQGSPERAGPPANTEQKAARERLRELWRQGPNPEDAFTRVFEVLTPPQQEFLRAKIEDLQTERMTEFSEPIVRDAVKRKVNERAGAKRGR